MTKYRNKPVVIDAEQFFANKLPWPSGVVERMRLEVAPDSVGDPDDMIAWIETLEGGHIVSDGDYIITGIKGERYPCKPDIFEGSYDRVEEPKTP